MWVYSDGSVDVEGNHTLTDEEGDAVSDLSVMGASFAWMVGGVQQCVQGHGGGRGYVHAGLGGKLSSARAEATGLLGAMQKVREG